MGWLTATEGDKYRIIGISRTADRNHEKRERCQIED